MIDYMVSIWLIIAHKKFKNLNIINHYIFKCHLTRHFYIQHLYLNEKKKTYIKYYLLTLVITWHPSYNILFKTYKTSSSNLIYEHIKKMI